MLAEIVAVVATGARLFVAGVFLLAAAHKLLKRLEFEGILGQYKILPTSVVPLFSRIVPGTELLTAALLVAWPAPGVSLAILLLVLYAGAIAINLLRSRRHIDCGCGGESTPLSPALVIRNLSMVVLLGTFTLVPANHLASFSGAVLACLFAVGLSALYVCFNQLLVNAGIYRRLWLGERVG